MNYLPQSSLFVMSGFLGITIKPNPHAGTYSKEMTGLVSIVVRGAKIPRNLPSITFILGAKVETRLGQT